MPTLWAIGGAGGVGAARHWRGYERVAKKPFATIRASDTALMKAGLDPRDWERPHNNSHEPRRSDGPLKVAANALAFS